MGGQLELHQRQASRLERHAERLPHAYDGRAEDHSHRPHRVTARPEVGKIRIVRDHFMTAIAVIDRKPSFAAEHGEDQPPLANLGLLPAFPHCVRDVNVS
jgi:hypothetical protein